MSSLNRQPVVIHWFRRDLRLEDNVALQDALQSGLPVMPIFIFDTTLLDALPSRNDARVSFIHRELALIKQTLESRFSSTLYVLYGKPEEVFESLVKVFPVTAVYANEDYEPYAIERDESIRTLLDLNNIPFHQCKDHVIFAKNEVVKTNGKPYTVFTPYSKAWLKRLESTKIEPMGIDPSAGGFVKVSATRMPSLEDLGFQMSLIEFPDRIVDQSTFIHYHERRDIPGEEGTTRLGVHLRFGTVSIRKLLNEVRPLSAPYLNELIWREFFQQILWHFPHVVTANFKSQYDTIQWRNDEQEFDAWCQGRTGYPLVDAGIRELNATGHMHNRVRMVVASFLTKHLLIDWRWGESYFAEKLLDYELASNNGNWQWAAGTGCDAAPYFRIFNPTEQAKKFDREGKYVARWIPELGTSAYPPPIVDHKMARQRVLKTYRDALEQSDQYTVYTEKGN